MFEGILLLPSFSNHDVNRLMELGSQQQVIANTVGVRLPFSYRRAITKDGSAFALSTGHASHGLRG